MNAPIIELKDVSIRFNLAKEKTDTVKQYLIKLVKHQLFFDEFWALKNVSFSVQPGESLALIGRNGCGKSTTLKLISGVMAATKGSVAVRGSIAPLIELGAGFDMELTARENIYMNGALMGHDRTFMNKHFDEIVDFSELQAFIDVPVKNFSSGMLARLGFSIATIVDAEILIVDEVLSVGDEAFKKKCEEKMTNILSGGRTLIFVSHASDQVKRLCKKAVWLDHGCIQMQGNSAEVCDAYLEFLKHVNDNQ
ncbi:MAG: ABC transporter ATP-binding protein [Clostridia bacterium]|nr:ABC transporter ATP-binding protein [Clostridia bacterium]